MGMHRSGTSLTARLLNLMGVYFGPEDALMEADRFNPKGYWERKDVYQLNKSILQQAGYPYWDQISSMNFEHLSKEGLADFNQQLKKLILRLDTNRPWFIKDPRLCLTFPLWRKHLEFPICIHVYRSPIQIAQSLRTRNGFSLQLGVALWEKYTIEALKATTGCPELLILHSDIMIRPLQVIANLYQQLTEIGCRGLRIPHEKEVLNFIAPELHRERGSSDLEMEFLNQQQIALLDAFSSGKILNQVDRNYLTLSAGAQEILELHEQNATLKSEHKKAQDALDNFQTSEAALRQDNQNLKTTLQSQQGLIKAAQAREKAAQAREVTLQERTTTLSNERDRLLPFKEAERRFDYWTRHLESNAEALFASWRWKVGCSVVQIAERLLGRRNVHLSADNMREIFTQIRAYRAQKDEGSTKKKSNIPERIHPLTASKRKRFSVTPSRSVDIVVCVHNALEEVRCCLQSIIDHTPESYRLLLVNDGSDPETCQFLSDFKSAHPQCILLENPTAQGYTKAANRGLRATNADYVVLLNSDTVVPRLWWPRLLECIERDPNIGIVGPLSNAASWQSIPKLFDSQGDWIVNHLPTGYQVNEMAELVYQVSPKRFPHVPFVNGFCFVLRRSVIDRIGYLDEENFPWGYGEENDYCLRAASAGFSLAIADHTYVYHAKSKSYSHERRLMLAAEGDRALQRKHDGQHIAHKVDRLRNQADLAFIRNRIQNALQGQALPIAHNSLRILFVLPVGGIGGGIHSVVQETIGMRQLGIEAQIATLASAMDSYQQHYPNEHRPGGIFFFFQDPADLFAHAAAFDVVIATTWDSPLLLQPFFAKHPEILPAYYVQDYEPWFFEQGSTKWQTAYDSYTLIKNMRLFAKTDWIRETLKRLHGVEVGKVAPSLDNEAYCYPASRPQSTLPIGIVAMIRPFTPRRGADRTLRVLHAVKNRFNERIRINLFGCDDAELLKLEPHFAYENHGVAIKETIANLYRNAEIFVDFSDYQAFGRTGLEAMACGCAVILPTEGGVYEYAAHEENALIVDTHDETALIAALERLIEDSALRQRLRERGLHTAANYSIQRAALSELSLLREAWVKTRQRSSATSHHQTAPLPLAVLVALRDDGKPAGSGNIRLLQPFHHPSIRGEVDFKQCKLADLSGIQEGVIAVQRTAIPSCDAARQLIEHCLRHDLPLILEIDDDLLNLHHKTGHEAGYPVDSLDALELLARQADRIVVSSPLLGETLRQYNPNIVCVPNALDETVWLSGEPGRFLQPPAPPSETPIRILYMGTRTHEHDLNVVKTAFQRLQGEYGSRLVLDVVGGIPDHVDSFGVRVKPEGIDPRSDAYTDFVHWIRRTNRWHFGIIPLELTPFNRQKSYIKFLDYSALGLASICSDIEPYRAVVRHGENGLLVNNDTEAWYAAIKTLIEDSTLRTRLAAKAFQDLTDKYILLHRARDFLNAYRF
ncbi:MAG: glycosyltransferase [Candidatus Competibacteraceae bacterium]